MPAIPNASDREILVYFSYSAHVVGIPVSTNERGYWCSPTNCLPQVLEHQIFVVVSYVAIAQVELAVCRLKKDHISLTDIDEMNHGAHTILLIVEEILVQSS